MSLFVWYFGTRRQYPDVAHHTILLGPRYRELLDDIFERKVLAEDFSLYLHRPTATDPSLAPPGCDAFYVLSPVPNLDSGTDWTRKAESYRRALERAPERDAAAGISTQRNRHVADADAAGLPGSAVVVSWRSVRPGAGAVAKRVVPSAQSQRGSRPALSRRRRHASRRRVCPACSRRRASSTRGSRCRRLRLIPTLAAAADFGACRALLRGGSRTFHAASFLLPRRVREPACALYAFCRLADDAVDGRGRRHGARSRRCTSGLTASMRGTAATRRRRSCIRRRRRALRDSARVAGGAARGLRVGCRGPALRGPVAALHGYAARVAGHGRRDDGSADGRRARATRWRAHATWAWRCNCPTSRATSARMRAPVGSICRSPGCAKQASIPMRGWLRLSHSAALAGDRASAAGRRATSCMRAWAVASRSCRSRAGRGSTRRACCTRRSVARSSVRARDAIARRAVVPARARSRLLGSARCRCPMQGGSARAAARADAVPGRRTVRGEVERRPATARERRTARFPGGTCTTGSLWTVDLFERLERREQVERLGAGD